VLAENIAVADHDARRLSGELEVLRPFAEHGPRVDAVALAHRERTDQVDLWPQDAAGPDPHGAFDDHMGSHHDVVGQLRLLGDHRARWDPSGAWFRNDRARFGGATGGKP